MKHMSKLFLSALLAVTLAACSALPRGAAIEKEVTQDATEPGSDIAVYPVTRAFLPSLATWPRPGPGRPGRAGGGHQPTARGGARPGGLGRSGTSGQGASE